MKMMKRAIFTLLFTSIFLVSCSEEERPLNFENVVDSSFVLSVIIDGVPREFQQLEHHVTSNGLVSEDSIVFSQAFKFQDTLENGRIDLMLMGISRVFALSDLQESHYSDDGTVLTVNLLPAEYQKVFPLGDIACAENFCDKAVCSAFPRTDGGYLHYVSGRIDASTTLASNYLTRFELDSLRANEYFELIDVEFLAETVVVFEGRFEMTAFRGGTYNGQTMKFSSGSFKAYGHD